MDKIKDQTPEQIVRILLRSVATTDRALGLRARRGEGPGRYVQQAMKAGAVVHALWPDDTAPGGYAHRVVSGQALAEGTAIEDRTAFRVSDRIGAVQLAATFGEGRAPRPGEPWVINLLIEDPSGGRDAHGNPELVEIFDLGT
ncbi:hypothetical protein AO398_00475 [Methylobacterium sp. GXS13]|jgi:hypothetical protein|uniref:hypothetical protein n=1 Tax=Methylobacterium sp. GXS13 TaxID=1730094 RepID=UPI00071BB0FF|nr:hypothetical protein [Methylobacterium sp. GXS13]KST61200.1 hypothetical protein AO398_00475 [Methylobacterium sp. GXS13]